MKKVSMLLLFALLCGGMAQANTAETKAAKEVQQSTTVRGTVKLATGEPASGASVVVVGTKTMAVVDDNGSFTLKGVPAGATLKIGLIGYTTQNVKVTGDVINVVLEEAENTLNEAVVTAMGIVRKEKSLTYSTQQIKSDDIMKVQDVNFVNSIEGKVAGITISPSAGGAGGSSKITLRGVKSILGSSDPLIVVDGVPMTNSVSGRISSLDINYGQSEGGDALSMINGDDIESVNVLKGANAAALYGSAAANGVLMITTKKGREGRLDVNFTSNVTFEKPLLTPDIQNVYGASITPSAGGLYTVGISSWGGRVTETPLLAFDVSSAGLNNFDATQTHTAHMRNYANNDVDDFYQLGVTTNNSISLSGGTDKIKSYFSYANSYAKGMIENNRYNRNTFAFRQSYNLWDRLQIDASLNYVQTVTRNRPGGGRILNPIYHLYTAPRNIDMNYYRYNYVADGNWYSGNQSIYRAIDTSSFIDYMWWDPYMPWEDNVMNTQIQDLRYIYGDEVYNLPGGVLYDYASVNTPLSGPMQQWVYTSAAQNNPYWLIKQNNSKQKEDRAYGTFTGKLKIVDGLSFQGRVSFDHSWSSNESKRYATTYLAASMENYGRYWYSHSRSTEIYTDYLLSYDKVFKEDWSVSATAGWVGHVTKGRTESSNVTSATYYDGNRRQVYDNVNIFEVSAGGPGVTSTSRSSNWDKAALFTAQFGWKDMIYIDGSYRRDWYRAFRQFKDRGTPDNYGYFGVGATAILSSLFKMPEPISYMKYRISYSEVGNSIPNVVYSSSSVNVSTGAMSANTFAQFRNPRPEKLSSFETGLEMLFFNQNLNLDVSFYNTISKNQYMIASNASGLSEPVNSGRIRNRGVEVTAGYNFRFGEDWRWKTQVNFSVNNNKILETVYEETTGKAKLVYTDIAGVRVRYRDGGSVGDMYVSDFQRNDDGTFVVSNENVPLIETAKDKIYNKYIGNMNSKYQLGWSNTISFKDFQLYFLISGRIGGKVISLTEAELDRIGNSKRTAEAREYAEANNLRTPSGKLAMYLPDGSNRLVDIESYYRYVSRNCPGNYVYNATNFRLRELSLGYTFRNLIGENKNLTLSFIARNLFFIYKDAPTDPDITQSTSRSMAAFENFTLPSTRSYGVSLKLNF